jgi:hypothetical protein
MQPEMLALLLSQPGGDLIQTAARLKAMQQALGVNLEAPSPGPTQPEPPQGVDPLMGFQFQPPGRNLVTRRERINKAQGR